MRKAIKSVIFTFIVLLIPYAYAFGQEKRSEQKLKVIIDDGSGKKIVMDTVFKDSPGPDSLKLKDGTVIFLRHPGHEHGIKHSNGTENVYVTYSSDSRNDRKETKEVTVISSDSLHSKTIKDGNKVVITKSMGTDGEKSETIYINKGKSAEKVYEKTYDVYVSGDDNESSIEKARYVIAKDGIVVTVEGSDKAKAEELVKEIKEKLGVNSEETGKKETVKAESEKTKKK